MKFNNELVIKARDGDIHAFEILVEELSDMAVGYAYSILKDHGQAEDAAQESFVQAYLKLKTLQSPEAFLSWFRRIVFSQCEHFYRKKRLPVVPLDDILETQSQELNPPEIVENGELKSQIFKAVNTLPEKERVITVLFYISGYSMAEIGKFLNLPISTVKNRLYSARKKLRGKMIELMGDTFKEQKTGKEFTKKVKNMIISGHKQALLVKNDGTVMNWGNKSIPAADIGLKNVKSIATANGCYGSYAVLNDGTVWAWGWNLWRHLGTGSDEEYIITPEQVKNLIDVVSVTAGVSHSLALKKDGTVWAWGKNWYGNLGNEYDESKSPMEITSLKNIKQISAGYFRTLALAEDGTVWRLGGYGDSRAMSPIVYAVSTPVQINLPGKITAISAGGMHDVMLCENGTVWVCGYNTQRQLGVNHVGNEVLDIPIQAANLTDVKAISAGGSFTLALKNDGTVWAWGENESGELGNGSY
ncbi:MAG: sigma-70 family RNA polymerase sigma factor, partial [Oscillospiraceae bacterium]|nr:sigma-70 family RNA polymerase sigma factor [Oscillospiraceae bacterium]